MKNITTLKAGVVFNMIKHNTYIHAEVENLVKELDIDILKTIITDRVSYTRSVIIGGILQSSDKKAKNEILSLADEILNRIGI